MDTNEKIFAGLPAHILNARKKMAQPLFIEPMLATLTDEYFSSNNWIYEEKFDGERCIVVKKKGKVYLVSRSEKSMNAEYPELVQALEQQAADNFIIDGEIIATGKTGVSDFQLLQGRINVTELSHIKSEEKKVPISLCIFDVMYASGYDLRQLPLLARKDILKKLLSFNKLLIYVQHKVGDGITFFKQACRLGWEGLIAKRADSIYVGERSPNWLKFKCIMKQELVIAGYTEPKGSRKYFGALLVGYYKKNKLFYAGKVGTGYTQEILKNLGTRLQKLEIKECPFANYEGPTKGIHWVKPEIVAEFQFAQWTEGGKLRVGRYKGLRDDKAAHDVVKEIPKAIGPE